MVQVPPLPPTRPLHPRRPITRLKTMLSPPPPPLPLLPPPPGAPKASQSVNRRGGKRRDAPEATRASIIKMSALMVPGLDTPRTSQHRLSIIVTLLGRDRWIGKLLAFIHVGDDL